MAIFKCKMCGGALEVSEGMTVCECEYCGTQQTLPKTDNEQNLNMFNRANHFRQQCEFDKAGEIYEKMSAVSEDDAEIYWAIVLCRYGIEYVDDPLTKKKIATCHRTQFKSILNDPDYLAAVEHADTMQRSIYEREAAYIDKIQKRILEISNKEQPFDVFICYKETDKNGRRTQDSVLAQELYYGLTQEGFKVFFSRITLESMLGTEYEPYIFAALNSSKVMVVIGTKPEYFNAVWVRNEWSRYLKLMQDDRNRTLIPAYKDMNPYDLPDALSMFQAQDMSKLGFMQDLIRGIKKIVNKESERDVVQQTIIHNTVQSTNISPLLKRAALFLEDKDWISAIDYCERVLDQDPENALAYLYKLMAELQVSKQEELQECPDSFDDRDNFKKVMRFGDDALKKQLVSYNAHINARNEETRLNGLYRSAKIKMEKAVRQAEFEVAEAAFRNIAGYLDSEALANECAVKCEEARNNESYQDAKALIETDTIESLRNAIKKLRSIPNWKDASALLTKAGTRLEELETHLNELKAAKAVADAEAQKIRIAREEELKRKAQKKKRIAIISGIAAIIAIITIPKIISSSEYNNAVDALNHGQFDEAIKVFEKLGDYKDSKQKIIDCLKPIRELLPQNSISSGYSHTVGLKADGTVIAVGSIDNGNCDVSDWKDIIAISAGYSHTVGLKADGTVIAVGSNDDGECDISDWKDIVAISTGDGFTVGLSAAGTVVTVGNNLHGQCEVSDWKDIVAVSAGSSHTVGLKTDGTVMAVGSNDDGECDVSDWKDIVAISAGSYHTVGLKTDGSVVATVEKLYGQCDVSDWRDIKSTK